MNKGKESLFSTVEKCCSILLGFFFFPRIYLILAKAAALLSVFWNKARTRFFTSELENSKASGPLLSAHLWRRIRDKSDSHTKEKRYSKILRSSSQRLLMVPQSHFKTRGDKSFRTVAPSSFKKQLKTHLFRLV